MKLSIERRSKRWVLRELDRSAEGLLVQTSLANVPIGQDFGADSNDELRFTSNWHAGGRMQWRTSYGMLLHA